MGTLQKSQKYNEKSINTGQLLKNNDSQLLNGFDHEHEAIRGRSWKIMISDAKIVRTARNRKNWTHFFPQLPRVGAQNIVQNRDFSQNPRWGKTCSTICEKSTIPDLITHLTLQELLTSQRFGSRNPELRLFRLHPFLSKAIISKRLYTRAGHARCLVFYIAIIITCVVAVIVFRAQLV